jgi:hypothetical protein
MKEELTSEICLGSLERVLFMLHFRFFVLVELARLL